MNLVIAVKCPYCGKFRQPREITRLGTGGAKICWHCLEWHYKAVRMLSGEFPDGCQVCGVTFRQLAERELGGDFPMYVHAKDGIYQILCQTCSDSYITARRAFFKETGFGRRLNLA